MGNMIAYAALILWPLVTLGLFVTQSTTRAIIWSLLLGYLVLPPYADFDFPGLPSFDKTLIPAISTLLLAMVMSRRGEFKWPKDPLLNGLVVLYLASPFVTGMLNGDPIIFFGYVRPGIDLYTAFTSCLDRFYVFIPFILGVGFLRNERAHRDLLLALVVGALAYSLPILLEVRLSPQLAKWIYGVSDTAFFRQQMRDGGFRAIVFLRHGLAVSDYITIAAIAAIGLARMRKPVWNIPPLVTVGYLAAILLLQKSLGAFVLAALIVPAVYYLRPRALLTAACVVGLLVISFPMTRAAGLVPVKQIENVVATFSAERAQSYAFRAFNEDALLSRARERPIFGWGPFGRWSVKQLTVTGEVTDATTSDGLWIITFGQYGWVGLIALFGLYLYGLWRGFRVSRRQALPLSTLPLVGIVTYNLVNALPNANMTPVTWLVAGALAGLLAPQRRSAIRRRPTAAGSAPSTDGLAEPVTG